MAASLVEHAGGDLWVMARGTKLFDFTDSVSTNVKSQLASHPCVRNVRGLLMTWSVVRKPSGGVDNVQLIGTERDERGDVFPWSVAQGIPSDLHRPRRVGVDERDVERLELRPPLIGSELQLDDRSAYVSVVTSGIRSFTVVPYVFAELTTAQILSGADHRVSYYLLDLHEQSCVPHVIEWVEHDADLQAITNSRFQEMTADYWLTTSGAGATLGFSAALGLLVGLVVVAQTLYAITENRLRELATLKTMGASSTELLSVVLWQAGLLALVGAALGSLMTLGARDLVKMGGLTLVFSGSTAVAGVSAVILMCGTAALVSGRRVLSLQAAEVFK